MSLWPMLRVPRQLQVKTYLITNFPGHKMRTQIYEDAPTILAPKKSNLCSLNSGWAAQHHIAKPLIHGIWLRQQRDLIRLDRQFSHIHEKPQIELCWMTSQMGSGQFPAQTLLCLTIKVWEHRVIMHPKSIYTGLIPAGKLYHKVPNSHSDATSSS